MKILVLSDISFQPIQKEINKIVPDWIIYSEYHEDLSIALMSDPSDNYDFVLIHSEQIFHNKPIEFQKSFFLNVIDFCNRNTSTRIAVSNNWSISFELPDLKNSLGIQTDATKFYINFFESLKVTSNLYIFDLHNIVFREGMTNLYNFSLGILYQMPYTKKMIQYVSREFVDFFRFLSFEEKKAIVLDCDNTLWRGVIGEDGIDGIGCDNNADSIIYLKFQQFLTKRKEDGFLLCLCSKNNENDVKEVFEKKNMPLKWNDFIIKKVSWNEKSLQVKEIAKELNINEDSLIFIDDSLFELDLIKKYTSVKECIRFSNDYHDFLELTQNYVFRKKRILEVDKQKTRLYEFEQSRKEEESKFVNINDYLLSLNIVLDIRHNDLEDFERISQLTGKTNQFNFNKRPYSISELTDWIENGHDVYSLKVSDKFGDYGTVGIILVNRNGKNANIENFLMSCRALGKKIEEEFFNKVMNQLENQKIILDKIIFQETPKNIPAQLFIKKSKYASFIKSIK